MNKFTVPFIICLIFTTIATGQTSVKTQKSFYDTNKEPAERILRLEHLTANISFEPKLNKVIGSAEFQIIANRFVTDSFMFYCPKFVLTEIKMGGKKTEYRIENDNVVIYPNEKMIYGNKYVLSFDYTASPEEGAIYFIGWNDPKNLKRKQIWAHRPHGWIPFYDDMLTMDLNIKFDKEYNVFANGTRESVTDNSDGTKTWHYKMIKKHPFFSTSVVIGDYQHKALMSKGGTPLELWYYPEYANRWETTYQYSEKMIDFFDNEMGVKYPYPLYKQAMVMDYMYGAMETTTATVFGDYMQIDPRAYWQRNYINVNAHELAHQWFGDCIAHLAPDDVWLTESFATYYAKLFEKSIFGQDYYQNDRRLEMDKAFIEAKTNNNPLASSRAGTNRIYQKGSLVLDMLRDVIGDDNFKAAIKSYIEKYQFNYAETHDLYREIFNTTGTNAEWFFNEWVLGGGEPHYEVSYTESDETDGNRFTNVKVKQIHQTDDLVGLFRMPVNFEVYYKDGSKDSIKEWVSEKENVIKIPNFSKKKIDFLIFDPGRRIFKNITFKRIFEELASQSLKATNMIDRYDALVELRSTPVNKKRATLIKVFKNETFHLCKSEVINQLADDEDSDSRLMIKNAIKDKDALVRRAVLDNVVNIPIDLKKEYEVLLKDSSYANIEIALQNLCTSFPKDARIYLEMTEKEVGWRGKNIRMKWLEMSYLNGNNDVINEIKDYTSQSYEFETRINSINILKRLNILDDEIIDNIFESSVHWNFKLATAGREALLYFYQQNNWKTMIDSRLKSKKSDTKLCNKIKNLLVK